LDGYWALEGMWAFTGLLTGVKPGTPGKVRHLDLRNQPGGGSFPGH